MWPFKKRTPLNPFEPSPLACAFAAGKWELSSTKEFLRHPKTHGCFFPTIRTSNPFCSTMTELLSQQDREWLNGVPRKRYHAMMSELAAP